VICVTLRILIEPGMPSFSNGYTEEGTAREAVKFLSDAREGAETKDSDGFYRSNCWPISGTWVVNPYRFRTRSAKVSAADSSPWVTKTVGLLLNAESQASSSFWSPWAENPPMVQTRARTAISSPQIVTD